MNDDMIGQNPNIMGGTACIRGTRITVYALEARINGGETPEAVSADYEGYITPEQIRAAVAYAGANPLVEHPEARPWRKQGRHAAE